MRMLRRLPAVALVALGIVLPTAQGYIIIDSFSSAKNDRFANNASLFVAAGFDLSGIAISKLVTSDYTFERWVTMISPNVYLSAAHYPPPIGASVTFYASNDPSGQNTTRTISSPAQRIPNSDLWIGTINQPLTSDYTFYDFAVEDIASKAGFESSTYYLEEAFMFGRSQTASWPTSQDMAVGRNKLDLWDEEAIVGGTTDSAVVAVRDPSGQRNFVASEAYLQGGDSGGGMFVDDGSGRLKLVGINWFIGTVQIGQTTYDVSGFSYVGNYDAEIQAFLDLHSVPEPAGLAAVSAVLALGFAAWHRNSRH